MDEFFKMVTSYGGYDVNGYRFRSEECEKTKSRLTTVNSGVCVSCVDENNNELEYYVPTISDEITDPNDLKFLSKLNIEAQDEDIDDDLEADEDIDDDLEAEEDRDDDQDDLPEYAPNDPNDF
ncbi:calsequestrin-1-like [Panicum virgatum]|uniref:calsequestrin-1-like n=1 Tax=Panicum virgatum TaxID=38727 RepID=UPI0019D69A62|nr:calsequestrin-1-like [Panicum virgatum]